LPWPDPSNYQEALQNPRVAFTDPDLKFGTVVTNKLGLPKPISGNFAVVFELQTGQRRWAVRCFLRETQDQEHRYAQIAQHLAKNNLKSKVGFQYLPRGVCVKGHGFRSLRWNGFKANVWTSI